MPQLTASNSSWRHWCARKIESSDAGAIGVRMPSRRDAGLYWPPGPPPDHYPKKQSPRSEPSRVRRKGGPNPKQRPRRNHPSPLPPRKKPLLPHPSSRPLITTASYTQPTVRHLAGSAGQSTPPCEVDRYGLSPRRAIERLAHRLAPRHRAEAPARSLMAEPGASFHRRRPA